MAKKAPTWLVVCGLGCGLLALIAVGLLIGGTYWVRGTVSRFDEAVQKRAALEEQLGQPGNFVPAPDGAVPAERVEAFLKVRESLAPSGKMIATALESLALSEEEARADEERPFFEKLGAAFSFGSSALGLAGNMGAFYRDRDDALLDSGMGMGEYTYIYVLAYYALLEHSPSDGPEGDEIIPIRSHAYDVVMKAEICSRIRGNLVAMLKSQLASLPDDAPAGLRADLISEIASMEEDDLRFPWQGNLPDAIRNSLKPFRQRLEAAYEPMTNPFELAQGRKHDKFSFSLE